MTFTELLGYLYLFLYSFFGWLTPFLIMGAVILGLAWVVYTLKEVIADFLRRL